MQRTPDETIAALEHLIEEVRALDRRVRALEGRVPVTPAASNGSPAEQQSAELAPELQPSFALPPSFAMGMVPVWGKAVLGIAGAYLLRGAAESGALPPAAVVAVSIAYAALWLVAAAATRPDREAVRVIYALTAALIFFPMLWETTVQFKVLAPPASAALLTGFAVLGAALGRMRGLPTAAWATALPAAATAVVLMVAMGEVAPFVAALLVICSVVEIAGTRGLWTALRPCVALLADIGVSFMIYLAALPEPIEAYRPMEHATAVSLCFVLLGIYAGSVGVRTAGLRRGITVFEILQLAVALFLAVGGTLRITHATAALGVFCVLSAGILYGIAFVRFSPAAFGRSQRIYAGLGLGLLLMGSAMLFSGTAAAMLWSAVAVAAIFASPHTAYPLLAAHGTVCLLASAFLSGLLNYSRMAMTSAMPPPPPIAAWIVTIGAVLFYAGSSRAPGGRWPRLVSATVAALAISAFLVGIIVSVAASGPDWLPTVRTLVLCAVALLAGVGSVRFPAKPSGSRRTELVWIGYATMASATLKLFTEDFRESPPAALAISLLCYGAVLLLGPRLTRQATQS